jgi:hypothetical protein
MKFSEGIYVYEPDLIDYLDSDEALVRRAMEYPRIPMELFNQDVSLMNELSICQWVKT